jgi:hypothetical protein
MSDGNVLQDVSRSTQDIIDLLMENMALTENPANDNQHRPDQTEECQPFCATSELQQTTSRSRLEKGSHFSAFP